MQGAVHIPLIRLLEHPELAGENRNTPIAVYCKSGYQSELAAACLTEAGYTNVKWYSLESIGNQSSDII